MHSTCCLPPYEMAVTLLPTELVPLCTPHGSVTLHSLTALFRPFTFSAVLLGAQGALCFNYTPPVTNGGKCILYVYFVSLLFL